MDSKPELLEIKHMIADLKREADHVEGRQFALTFAFGGTVIWQVAKYEWLVWVGGTIALLGFLALGTALICETCFSIQDANKKAKEEDEKETKGCGCVPPIFDDFGIGPQL